jgi:hypothetical protein
MLSLRYCGCDRRTNTIRIERVVAQISLRVNSPLIEAIQSKIRTAQRSQSILPPSLLSALFTRSVQIDVRATRSAMMQQRAYTFETPSFGPSSHAWTASRSPTMPRLPQLHALAREASAQSSSSNDYYFPQYTGSTDGSSMNSPLKSSSPVAPPPEPKKNASRERMKSELVALRVQAGVLETELAYLQQLAQERISVDAGGGVDDCEPIRNSREPSGGWKALAERQRARRIRAEMQNRRLRTTIESQMEEWKSLQSLFDVKSQSLLDKIANVHGITESALRPTPVQR